MNILHINDIIWHDLPLELFVISSDGLQFQVSPYCESSKSYYSATLTVKDADSLSLEITGKVSRKELVQLEVARCTFVESAPGRINGELGIIPGSPTIGYWSVKFTNAICELRRVPLLA